jgi:phosphoribosyl-AMP cyclohydrolase
VHYRTWFVGETHVSVGAASTGDLRAAAAEPVPWALGFTGHEPAVWVWQTAAAVAALGDPPEVTHPPAPPELEDFVEYAAKALRAGDEIGLRLAAQGVGREAIPLLLELNPQAIVRTRREAVDAARTLRVAPGGWPHDLLVLLGLADGDVRGAVERVAHGVLGLLREAGSGVGRGQPDLNAYLHDGTLERQLRGA